MAKTVFRTRITIKFREADPAQIMYFGNLFSLAHDVFEEFIVAAGYKYREWFRKGDLIVPIRHAEADFLSPFLPGDIYDVDVTVALMKETSFQMKYVFSREGKIHGQVKMVHAIVELKTMKKAPVPEQLRSRLAPYVETP